MKNAYRFRDKSDLEFYFQQELDKFPRKTVNGEEQAEITEFGAILIRPKGEPKNRLTHVMFPETLLGIRNIVYSLKDHSSRTFPQVVLVADVVSNRLLVKVTAHRNTDDGLIERLSLLLTSEQVFFTSDIWRYISKEDRSGLSENGFGPGMSHADWALAINNYLSAIKPTTFVLSEKGDRLYGRELPALINEKGVVGASGSFHLMPDFILEAIEDNCFVYEGMEIPDNEEEVPYEIGSAHIHPLSNEMSPLQSAVADIVGEDVIRRTPSIPDIAILRASLFANSEISLTYRGRDINTTETFLGILTVDKYGKVTGSRYLDLGDVDQKYLKEINNKAKAALNSRHPDVQVIAQHYRYIDSVTKKEFGVPGTSQHVGDPDYTRISN